MTKVVFRTFFAVLYQVQVSNETNLHMHSPAVM